MPDPGLRHGVLSLGNPRPGDLGWIIHRQAVLYTRDYGWNDEFEALLTDIIANFTKRFDPAREAAWIARIDGRIVGSIFLVRGEQAGEGKLRMLYVEPDARGAGVGAALIDACIARARNNGYERLLLWTNSILIAARRLYERAGFVLIEEAPHRSFGHDLVSQTWALDLRQTAPAGSIAH